MQKTGLQSELKNQFADKELFEQAKKYSFDYIDRLQDMDVFPSGTAISDLKVFDEPLLEDPCPPSAILSLLNTYGSNAAVAQNGGKYFGFVCVETFIKCRDMR